MLESGQYLNKVRPRKDYSLKQHPGNNLSDLETILINRINADLSTLTADEKFELLKSRSVHIVKEGLLKERLLGDNPLMVKYGIDPTAKDIHLGHVVPLIVVRRLLNMGHKVVLIIGDFTALVGDPTGRVSTRPILTREEIEVNLESYKGQIGKFLPIDKIEVVRNSTFFDDMSITELVSFFRKNKISPLLQREDFRKRLDGLTIAEAIYPTFMAIDSVKLEPDIELGGNDQLLNFQTAASFMEAEGIKPQSALTTELLLGTAGDGSKMSKSKGNYIAVDSDPDDCFGKIMSIPDDLMEHYFKLLTDITDSEWGQLATQMKDGKLNPSHVKKLLAHFLTTILSDSEKANAAQDRFEETFAKHSIPTDIPEIELIATKPTFLVDLLVTEGLVDSKSQVRRLIDQSGLKIISQDQTSTTVTSYEDRVPDNPSFVLKIGKRKFYRFIRP